MKLLYLPFLLQGVVMFLDEFYFHEKRGLPRWERWGHPLDTLTVLVCFSYLLFASVNVHVYIGICTFSSLFITKDEIIHSEKCSGLEHWLHSVLFILHPVTFFAAWMLWQQQDFFILKLQTVIILFFMSYQFLRWSFPWRILIR